MTKPADEDVLLLRIKALLRRAKITAEHQLRIGHTILNYDALTVTTDKDLSLIHIFSASLCCHEILPARTRINQGYNDNLSVDFL